MFYTSFDDLPVSFCTDWNNRIRLFQRHGTVLPCWYIRFHGYIPVEINTLDNKIGNVGDLNFYKTTGAYWICRFDDSISIAIKMSLDYTTVDVFCKKGQYMAESISGIYTLLCQAYCYKVAKDGGVILHAASVSYRGDGIAFFGHSGAGKSTQACLWKKYKGADVINYDRNYVYKKDGAYWISSTPWGGKEKYYVNKSVPLKALVFVQKSMGENRVDQIKTTDGFSTLYLHNYLFPLEEDIENKFYLALEDLAKEIPVFVLYCTQGEDAVSALYDKLYGL